eukprot:926317_1
MKLRTSFLSLLATVLFIHQTSASVGECSRYRGGIHNRNSNQTPVNYLGRFHTPQVSIDQNEVNIQPYKPNANANKSNTPNLTDNADSIALSLSKHYKRNVNANNVSPPNPNLFAANVSSHSSPNPYQFNSNRSSPSPWNQYRHPLGFGIFADSPDLLNQHSNSPWPLSPSRLSVNSNPPDLPYSDSLNANTNNSNLLNPNEHDANTSNSNHLDLNGRNANTNNSGQLNPNEHDANTNNSNQLNLNGRNAYTNNSAQLNLKLNLNGRNAYTNDSGQMNSNERNAYTKKSNQLRPNSLHSSTNNANAQDLPNSNGFNSNTNSSSQQNPKRYDANSNKSIPLNRNNPFSVCMSERSYTHLKQPLNRNNSFSQCMSERRYTHSKQPLNRNNPFSLCMSERSYITHSKQPQTGSNNAEIREHKYFGKTHNRSKSHRSVQYANTSAYSTTHAAKRVGNRYIGPKSSMTERLKRHKELIHQNASSGKLLASQDQQYHPYERYKTYSNNPTHTAATTGSHNLSQSSKIPTIQRNFEMLTKLLKNRIPQNNRNINKLAHRHSKVSKNAQNRQRVLRHNRSSNRTERAKLQRNLDPGKGKRKRNVNDINNYPYRIPMPDMSVSHFKLHELR